ncbi:hypothetical protein [Methylomonas methanica]|uniref:Uncharacterized protein n=1 Tax=Methylomonas methanica (strain DSM 25384 / MC09) TaxID=857087 RepID=G0A1U3_METMM|nr:hypothetical protein [Methylomonas methanica]AEG01326.1 hypothetical protein Metme_2946 [Methylomonas methanica MC09]
MAIQKEFVVRYRSKGHVRFQIPPRVARQEAAKRLAEKIEAIDGVVSVRLFRRSGKLSIRYDESVCRFIDLAKQLFADLAALEQQGCFAPQNVVGVTKKSRSGLKQKLKISKINRWLDEKITAAKETAQAAKVIGKFGSKGPRALFRDPEKAVIDFLNDILILYLIKVHWNRITTQWLVKPLVHRYEWMATFYLFFLLVRSRKPK